MQRRAAVVTVLTYLAVAGAARAEGPAFLVKDINTTQAVREPYEDEPSSYPYGFTVLDGIVYFAAGEVHDTYGEPPNGIELWRSDGTPAGTGLVKDIWPGPESSRPIGLQTWAGALYFLALDQRGLGWFRSDGTAAGTELLGTTGSGGTASAPVRLGSRWLTLVANAQGLTLWSVDAGGSFEPISALFDRLPASDRPYYSAPPELVAGNRVAYFFLATPGFGRELWRTDGTASGTGMVADIEPGIGSSNPRDLIVVGDTAFFVARDEAHGEELWRADEQGATLVADLVPGPDNASPVGLTVLDGGVVFATDALGSATALWRTDGTSTGTVRIASIESGVVNGPFTPFAGALFFGAGTDAPQLWRTDGTPAGTVLVREFATENGYVVVPAAANAGDHLLTLVGTYRGVELWRSDGTAAGTTLVRTFDWITDRYGGALSGAVAGNGAFVFPADDGTGVEPWRSDGTAEGTAQLLEINPGATDISNYYDGTYPAFADLNGTLVFIADDRQGSEDVWQSDGTEAGTRPIGAIMPDPNFSPLLIAAGDGVYFSAYSPEAGSELWQASALGEPARLLADVYPGSNGSYPVLLGNLDGELIFSADDGVSGRELWAPYDAGLIADLVPAPGASSWPRAPVILDDGLYFLADTALWRTDGTAPGTMRIAELDAGYDASMIGGADRLAVLVTWSHGTVVWYSDGSPAGTRQVGSSEFPVPDAGPAAFPRLLGFAGSTLLFTAYDPQHGVELWRSDGTPGGAELLADLRPGPASSNPNAAASRGDAVLLFADDGMHGYEPWITDGGAGATRPVADLNPGPPASRGSSDEPAAVVGDVFVFGAADATHGLELWRSDGTAAGTSLLDDIAPGPRSSSPTAFTRSGTHLFFTANDNQHGRELWAVALGDIGCTENCPDPRTPSPTPRRTPRPIWTPGPPLPTHTATGTPTPKSTPHCHQPGDGDDCVFLSIDSVTGAPGERVDVGVTLRTGGIPVAGVQLDLLLDLSMGTVHVADGEQGPDCRVNPAIGKPHTGFSRPFADGTTVRALVLSLSDTDRIADGSLLFTCTYEIAAGATPATIALYCRDALGSTPEGRAIAPANQLVFDGVGELVCSDGAITIAERVEADPAPTGTPRSGLRSTSDGGGGCQIGAERAAASPWPLPALALALLLPRLAARRGIIGACHASRRKRPRARAAPRASA